MTMGSEHTLVMRRKFMMIKTNAAELRIDKDGMCV
jgi:hypothetical protein